jgi:hypothetical protein
LSRFTPSSSGRRPSRRVLIALVGLGAALVVAVPVAWASHQFTDVPDSNPFHGDIAAISGAGITSGKTCVPPGAPPTYCPSEGITREAMAAFVHRGFGRTAFNFGAEADIPDTGRDLAVVTIQVGGVAGNTQFVKLDGVVTTYAGGGSGCPCTGRYFITQDGGGVVSFLRYNTNDDDELAFAGLDIETGAVSAVVAVPTASTQTFRIFGDRVAGGQINGYGDLTAVTVPFGSTGGNTLGSESTRTGGRLSGGK